MKKMFCGWHAVLWLVLMAWFFGLPERCRAGGTIIDAMHHAQMTSGAPYDGGGGIWAVQFTITGGVDYWSFPYRTYSDAACLHAVGLPENHTASESPITYAWYPADHPNIFVVELDSTGAPWKSNGIIALTASGAYQLDQPAVTKTHSHTLTMTNTYNQPLQVTYKDKVTGQVLFQTLLQPGENLLWQYDNPGGHDVAESFTLPVGATYTAHDSENQLQNYTIPAGYSWDGADIPSTDFTTEPPVYETPTPRTSIAPIGSGYEGGDVAGVTGNSTLVDGRVPTIQFTHDVSAGGATDTTVRDGFNAVVGKMSEMEKTSPGGGSGTVSQIDQDAETAKNNNPSDAAVANAVSTAQQTMADNYNAAIAGDLVGDFSMSDQSVESDIWTVRLPLATGGNITIDLNPMHNATIVSIYNWFKLILTCIILYLFEAFCWEEFKSYAVFLPLVPQAHGNPVAAGTGAQATALVAAAALATVLCSLPAWLWAIYHTAFGNVGVQAATNVLGAATNPSVLAAYGLLVSAVPVGLILIVLAQVVVVRKAGLLVFSLAAVAIKFVVP